MRCPFRTRSIRNYQTRHGVPGCYEMSRWDIFQTIQGSCALPPQSMLDQVGEGGFQGGELEFEAVRLEGGGKGVLPG